MHTVRANRPFKRDSVVKHRLGSRVGLVLFLEVRVLSHRHFQRDVPSLHWWRDELCHPVSIAIRHLQHARHVAHRTTRCHRAKRTDICHAVRTILLGTVLDDLTAARILDVDVDVGHRDAVGVKESLKQQIILQWVEVSDIERIGDDRPSRRSSPWPKDDTLVLPPVDEILDNQKVPVIAHLVEHRKLHVEPLYLLRR